MTEVISKPATSSRADEPGRRSAFGAPRGAVGWLAGLLMARVNAGLNAAAVDVLAPERSDRVLEIGFGHGRTVRLLSERAGHVAGVDPSAVLVGQARRHNRAEIRAGRVELQEASVADIPYPDESFSKALAVNCYQHWPDPEPCASEVARVLSPEGILVLGLRLHDAEASPWTGPGFQPTDVEAAEQTLLRAGFDVRRVQRRAGRDLTCLVATKR